VSHKLVITRQVRAWLHALRSGGPGHGARLVAEAHSTGCWTTAPALGASAGGTGSPGPGCNSLKELRPGLQRHHRGCGSCSSSTRRANAVLAGRGETSPAGGEQWYRDAIPAGRGGLRGIPEGKGTAMSEETGVLHLHPRGVPGRVSSTPTDRPAVEEAPPGGGPLQVRARVPDRDAQEGRPDPGRGSRRRWECPSSASPPSRGGGRGPNSPPSATTFRAPRRGTEGDR